MMKTTTKDQSPQSSLEKNNFLELPLAEDLLQYSQAPVPFEMAPMLNQSYEESDINSNLDLAGRVSPLLMQNFFHQTPTISNHQISNDVETECTAIIRRKRAKKWYLATHEAQPANSYHADPEAKERKREIRRKYNSLPDEKNKTPARLKLYRQEKIRDPQNPDKEITRGCLYTRQYRKKIKEKQKNAGEISEYREFQVNLDDEVIDISPPYMFSVAVSPSQPSTAYTESLNFTDYVPDTFNLTTVSTATNNNNTNFPLVNQNAQVLTSQTYNALLDNQFAQPGSAGINNHSVQHNPSANEQLYPNFEGQRGAVNQLEISLGLPAVSEPLKLFQPREGEAGVMRVIPSEKEAPRCYHRPNHNEFGSSAVSLGKNNLSNNAPFLSTQTFFHQPTTISSQISNNSVPEQIARIRKHTTQTLGAIPELYFDNFINSLGKNR